MQLLNTLTFLSTALSLVSAIPMAKEEIPPLASGVTTLLGPASYDDLKAQVEAQSINQRDLSKRAIGGLYLCEDWGFKGNCYYGVYELGKDIIPDPWWSSRISSVGPDQGTYCVFSTEVPCFGRIGAAYETFYYDGGDLNRLNDKVACFACYAS